ncbi:hypothetical protein TEQG_07736 [Trichophyton equinum CBS 127.97]|uniref:Uncharacterized protein n=1 Tax=Trichophyton equinum (strain ATCC MYA-4606 / CBS 127.97) TaxID=559882 RepID=F2Q3R1_TRIEC|nr:hypothetical protein TEQG_07736 [Trichophyton equinum CBS 127.97]
MRSPVRADAAPAASGLNIFQMMDKTNSSQEIFLFLPFLIFTFSSLSSRLRVKRDRDEKTRVVQGRATCQSIKSKISQSQKRQACLGKSNTSCVSAGELGSPIHVVPNDILAPTRPSAVAWGKLNLERPLMIQRGGWGERARDGSERTSETRTGRYPPVPAL